MSFLKYFGIKVFAVGTNFDSCLFGVRFAAAEDCIETESVCKELKWAFFLYVGPFMVLLGF